MNSPREHSDLFSMYFQYNKDSEVPAFFTRWSLIAGLGAFLGRQYYFSHGHFCKYPNIYSMLIGSPGTRKSTAIKLIKSILQKADYTTIAADRTTKEKFMLDLAGEDSVDSDLTELAIFGTTSETKEILIAADEFNDFIGLGNLEFISLLGTFWDYNGTYHNRIKNGKSVAISNPTVSILGGNTPTGFSMAFPLEAMGQGFFSRLLLVYGEPSGRKITFPVAPAPEDTALLVEIFRRIRVEVRGAATLTSEAESLLDRIYKTFSGLPDVRFESYSNRRFDHLLKLCLIVSAARLSTTITEEDVIYANTILTHTEHLMPKALGEFGKSRNSDVVHKIMLLFDSTHEVLALKDVWKTVVQDLDKMDDLVSILRNLSMADKIMAVNGGFLSRKKVLVESNDGTVDFSLLQDEEREGVKL